MYGKYSNLYNTSAFIPPSILAKIEKSMPERNEVYGEVKKLHGNNTIENATNQNYMNNTMDKTLRNYQNYRDMKNKIIFSLDSDVTKHSALNKL